MRIEVTRSGGFAGVVRRAVVDTAELPDAERWQALAEEALADGAGPSQADSPVRDGFRYEITVGDRVVETGERDLTPAQRELTARVLREGARG
ncbi:protealysin inhibitor emfourin [Streptomyces abyssomicinicus]|uniref:protealysin inhibitor emfourin n=1 Tax=Streptomyces abyssomicinicus TaxID=574929 RepID=UPI0012506039|nr:protealysin inhibitor emfourin [Streptomyces abyssomicinicus]